MTTTLLVGIVILTILLWLALKAVKFAVRLALYAGMALVAYWLFAQAFGLPLPAFMGGHH